MATDKILEISEELWDKHSQLLGTDIDDLSYFAGRDMMTRADFYKAAKEIATSPEAGAIWQEQQGWVRVVSAQLKELERIEGEITEVKKVIGGSIAVRFKNGNAYWIRISKQATATIDSPGSTPVESKEGKYRAALEKIDCILEFPPTTEKGATIDVKAGLAEIQKTVSEALKP